MSRGFVQASAAKLREMQERDLTGEDVVARYCQVEVSSSERAAQNSRPQLDSTTSAKIDARPVYWYS